MEQIGKVLSKLTPQDLAREAEKAEPCMDESCYGDPKCPKCRGFGRIHPRLSNGKIDYSRNITCACSIARLNKERTDSMIKSCALPEGASKMTFENFDYHGKLKEAYDAALLLAEEKGEVRWLTLGGHADLGKTHLAVAICNRWLKRGRPARYAFVPQLLDELRSTYDTSSKESLEEKLDFYCNIPLLVLDDLGAEKPTAWAFEKLLTIVNRRLMNRLALVVTTNKSVEGLPGDDEHRLSSRLQRENYCKVVLIHEVEYRLRRKR